MIAREALRRQLGQSVGASLDVLINNLIDCVFPLSLTPGTTLIDPGSDELLLNIARLAIGCKPHRVYANMADARYFPEVGCDGKKIATFFITQHKPLYVYSNIILASTDVAMFKQQVGMMHWTYRDLAANVVVSATGETLSKIHADPFDGCPFALATEGAKMLKYDHLSQTAVCLFTAKPRLAS